MSGTRAPKSGEAFPSLLQQELPQALQRVLPALLDEAMARNLATQHPIVAQTNTDGPAAKNLAVSTVRDTVDQCLDDKWKAMRQAQLEDTEKLAQKANTDQTKQFLDKYKEVQTALDAQKQQIEALSQLTSQAGKTEQVRFQTLDGAVRNRVEVMETNVKSRLDLLSSDLTDKFHAVETAQARLDVYVAKLEGLVEKMETIPGKFGSSTDRVESLVRERTTSVQQDVNKLAGHGGEHGGSPRSSTCRLTGHEGAP